MPASIGFHWYLCIKSSFLPSSEYLYDNAKSYYKQQNNYIPITANLVNALIVIKDLPIELIYNIMKYNENSVYEENILLLIETCKDREKIHEALKIEYYYT